jgi:hypothetical protein
MRFEVLTVVNIMTVVLLDMTLSSSVDGYHFRET